MSVPPTIVPLKALSPPLLKMPALPMSRVAAVLSRVPDKLNVLPAARENVPKLEAVTWPPRFRVAPAARLMLPALLRFVPVSVRAPTFASMDPPAELDQLVGVTLSVPAVTRKIPLLVKVVGLIVRVWPAVLARMTPLLTTVAAELLPI